MITHRQATSVGYTISEKDYLTQADVVHTREIVHAPPADFSGAAAILFFSALIAEAEKVPVGHVYIRRIDAPRMAFVHTP